jgi:hypothetical protein
MHSQPPPERISSPAKPEILSLNMRGTSKRPIMTGEVVKRRPKSATSEVDYSPCLAEMKKPLDIQRLQDGAGEEGRTPDLMLGKHTL